MLISDLPAICAQQNGERTALIFQGRTTSFATLRDRCWRLSNALEALAARGDRVAILASNCTEYVECSWGVPGAGMILHLLNYRLAPPELAYVINDTEPTVVIVEAAHADLLASVLDRTPSVRQVVYIERSEGGRPAPLAASAIAYEDLLAGASAVEPEHRGQETDIAWLLHTSGTTGVPKGAMLSHRNLTASMMAAAIGFDWTDDDVALFMMPQFHMSNYIFGVYHLRNVPVVVSSAFEVSSYLATVQTYAVTTHAIAPTMVGMILDSPLTAAADLSSLRTMIYGASAMPVDTLIRARQRLPQVGFGGCYGMTELSGNVNYLTAADHQLGLDGKPEILLSAGRSLPGARVKVVDEGGRDCAPGVAGEVVVQGDTVLEGYWRKPEATAEAFTGPWFHTGDIGRFDEAGRIYIVDRKKDMILTGGENVYPREVEELLYTHPDVAEVAVVGVADARWGERVVAVVRLRGGAVCDEAALLDFCRPRIAGYKRPKAVVFQDDLPKNASGKILRRVLRDALQPDA
ncbi:long-chain fatty acid--CoA ligase [soil metagenome]